MKIFLLLIFLFISCGGTHSTSSLGGAEIGNPSTPTRTVVGFITGEICVVDEVVATDSSHQITRGDIDASCSFYIQLNINKFYTISFLKEDNFVASIVFDRGDSEIESPNFYLSESEEQVNLGEIMIEGSEAYPAHQPSLQSDRDHDGINDFEDEDDDNDGQLDDLEIDCDLNGFFDEDDDDCEEEKRKADADSSKNKNTNNNQGENDHQGSRSEDNQNRILEVTPRHQEKHVNLNKKIKIRLGCKLNIQSLNQNSLVMQTNGESFFCDLELKANNTRIECRLDRGFIPSSIYQVHLSGLECLNGMEIPGVDWHFETVSER